MAPLLPPASIDAADLGTRFAEYVRAARAAPALRTAVIHPCDELSLKGALSAKRMQLIVPVLVGPISKIRLAASRCGADIEGVELVDAPHSHAAAVQGVALARAGQVHALMKGALHSDEIMAAAVDSTHGLRTGRRMSHAFVFDMPSHHKLLYVADAAVNIQPTLEEKRDIVQNTIELAQALGTVRPKVAVLSAVETVYPPIASTVDAAALCKMAQRGQIVGAIVDGPLGLDTAISLTAARAKLLESEVAGDADILIVPDIESGNMLAKQFIHLSHAYSAGLVLGARVPIILTSRSDAVAARVVSCALAGLHARWQQAQSK